jgi:hypothetical protein
MSVFLQWLLTGLRSADTAAAASRIARQLAGPMLTYHAALPRMGYGLVGVRVGRRTVWMKGGDAPSHSAVIAVIPELDVALFIALNRQEAMLRDQLIPSLVEKFWSDSSPSAESGAASLVTSPQIDGTYRWTRAAIGSPEKILGLALQVRVAANANGVSLSGLALDGQWQRGGADSFRQPDGRSIAFRLDGSGRASHFFSSVSGQPVSFERLHWHETMPVQLGGFTLASILALMAAGIALKRDRSPGAMPSPAWARAAVIALPVIEAGMIAAGVMLAQQADLLTQAATGTLRTTLALTTVTAAVAVAQAAGSIALASRGGASVTRRTLHSVGAIGGVTLAWFLGTNNLIRLPF